jgi:hypothetical protein
MILPTTVSCRIIIRNQTTFIRAFFSLLNVVGVDYEKPTMLVLIMKNQLSLFLCLRRTLFFKSLSKTRRVHDQVLSLKTALCSEKIACGYRHHRIGLCLHALEETKMLLVSCGREIEKVVHAGRENSQQTHYLIGVH